MSATGQTARLAHKALWRRIRRRLRYRPVSWIQAIPHVFAAIVYAAWAWRSSYWWAAIAEDLRWLWVIALAFQILFLLPVVLSAGPVRVRTKSSNKPLTALAIAYQIGLISLLSINRPDIAALLKYGVAGFVNVNRSNRSAWIVYGRMASCLAAVVFIGFHSPIGAIGAALAAIPLSWIANDGAWSAIEALPSQAEFEARWLDACDIGGG